MGSADVNCLSQRSIDKPCTQRSQVLHQAAAADTGSLLESCHACTILMNLNMRLHTDLGAEPLMLKTLMTESCRPSS